MENEGKVSKEMEREIKDRSKKHQLIEAELITEDFLGNFHKQKNVHVLRN